MNRATLKARARQSISWASPPVWMVSAVYAVFGLAVSVGINYVTSFPLDFTSVSRLMASLTAALTEFMQTQRYWLTAILVLALRILIFAVDAGYIKYCLDISRNKKSGAGTLFELVHKTPRYIGLGVLVSLAAGIPTALFLPALLFATIMEIVALQIVLILLWLAVSLYIGLGLSMTTLAAVDNPEMSVTRCIGESWRLMQGRRLEYLVLTLSFFGWALLLGIIGSIPGNLAYILYYVAFSVWLTPYMDVTYANYYSLISGRLPLENHPPQSTTGPQQDSRPPLDEDMWKH